MVGIFETYKDNTHTQLGRTNAAQTKSKPSDGEIISFEQGLCQRLTEQDILHNCQRRLLTLQTVFYVMAIIVLIKWLFKH